MSLSRKNQQINNRRSKLDYISIYSRIRELTICLLLKKLQLLFQKKGYIVRATGAEYSRCHDLAK